MITLRERLKLAIGLSETGPLVRPREYMAKVSSVLQRNISSGKRL